MNFLAHLYLSGKDKSGVLVGNFIADQVKGKQLASDKSKTTLLKCPVGKEGELIIPNGVKKIHPNAFSNCKITEVTIPNSLIEIGRYSFSHCTLKSITCNCVNPPAMHNKYGFYGVDKNIPVYVPSKSVAKYKNSDDWKEFKNILPISDK